MFRLVLGIGIGYVLGSRAGPPISANAVIVTCRSAKVAWVRSMSTPPIRATAVNCGGTTQVPLRVAPDMMPMATVDVGNPPTLAGAEERAVSGPGLVRRTGGVATRGTKSVCPGRSQVTGSRSLSVLDE